MFPAREKAEETSYRRFEAKTPYVANGHLDATLDAKQIEQWWKWWPNALVAVNAGKSGLVVADIDMGEDAQTGEVHDGWSTLTDAGLDEMPPTWAYPTNRGGDHYVYADPQTVPLGPTQAHETPDGTKLPDVDRRAGSSYFLVWGDDIPTSREAFAPAPDWLLTPAKPSAARAPFLGSLADWYAAQPEGEPGPKLQAKIAEIPTEDFNHSQMLSLQAAMVALSEQEPGVKTALETLKAAWLREPWNTSKYQIDWSRSLRGAIQKYGPRPPLIEGLSILDVQSRLPSTTHDGRDFLTEGIGGMPANDTPGALWAHRSRVLKSLLAADFTPQEAATLVWMAPSAKSLNSDLDGIRKLWAEVDEAQTQSAASSAAHSGESVSPAPSAERPALRGARPKVELLTLEERAWVEGDAGAEWWGSRYVAHYKEVLPIMSEPYFRLGRWFVLAGCFSDKGIIPREGESDLVPNIYGLKLGPTTSGKSESESPVYEILTNFHQGGDGYPSIGGNATPEALHEKLIERDGKASWFHADEADKILRDWSKEIGPYSGMKQVITFGYDGRVAAILRATKKDISGKSARVALSTQLTGVAEKVLAVIEPEDWSSGFINRFVWAEGEKFPRDDKALRFNLRKSNPNGAPRPKITQYWAAEFQQAAQKIARPDGRPVELDIEEAVLERHISLSKTILGYAAASKFPQQLEATFDRLRLTVMKCGALIAMSEGRKVIELRDYLIAAHQAEEWSTNILSMVERTQETPWVKQLNYIEASLADRAEGVMPKSELYRLMSPMQLRKRDVDELLDNLVAQGRVERRKRQDTGEEIVCLKEEK